MPIYAVMAEFMASPSALSNMMQAWYGLLIKMSTFYIFFSKTLCARGDKPPSHYAMLCGLIKLGLRKGAIDLGLRMSLREEG